MTQKNADTNRRILFLDDDPKRRAVMRSKCPWVWCVETVEECLQNLRGDSGWGYVYLDHDLGGEEFVDSARADCGMEVVRWLAAHPTKVGLVVVHSHNGKARAAMVDALVAAGYNAAGRAFYRNAWSLIEKRGPVTDG